MNLKILRIYGMVLHKWQIAYELLNKFWCENFCECLWTYHNLCTPRFDVLWLLKWFLVPLYVYNSAYYNFGILQVLNFMQYCFESYYLKYCDIILDNFHDSELIFTRPIMIRFSLWIIFLLILHSKLWDKLTFWSL